MGSAQIDSAKTLIGLILPLGTLNVLRRFPNVFRAVSARELYEPMSETFEGMVGTWKIPACVRSSR
jgi:hypothetical protein